MQEPGQLDPNLCVMLAEVAAKAAEHAALLHVLTPALDTAAEADAEDGVLAEEQENEAAVDPWSFRAGDTPWFVPLGEAKSKTGVWAALSAWLAVAAAHCGLVPRLWTRNDS